MGGAAAGGAPAGAGGGRAARAGGGGGRGRGAAAITALNPNDWNPIDILLAGDTLRATPGGGGALGEHAPSFGMVALFAGGTSEVRFKDVSWKDLNSVVEPAEQVSPNFTMKHVSNFYYGWSAAAADFNKDGAPDIVSGPFYYLGPSFTEHRIYRADRVYNPATEYAPDMVNFAADFTGDGWPDILASEMGQGRPMDLYVNPHGEPRKWDKFQVLPKITTELVLMKDLDGDSKPEIIYGSSSLGAYAWAHPDPANPTAEWTSHPLAAQGEQRVNIHGLGVGDVNGDGRPDIVVPFGWYEQPPKGQMEQPWAFHEASFGGGGGEIGVYDVNGDGLPDVVTSLAAHGFGLAWFEQKKGADGSRTFEEHMIADDFSTKNAGDVVFSEPHALALRGHGRRQDPGLHRRQALLVAPRKLQRRGHVRAGGRLHLPHGAKPESARRGRVPPRARPQSFGDRLGVRGGRSEQRRQTGHRRRRRVWHARLPEQAGRGRGRREETMSIDTPPPSLRPHDRFGGALGRDAIHVESGRAEHEIEMECAAVSAGLLEDLVGHGVATPEGRPVRRPDGDVARGVFVE